MTAPAPLLDVALFDMDGTLVDSTAVVEQTWSAFCSRHGLDLREVLDFAHGRPTASTTARFLDDPALARAEAVRIAAEEEGTTDGIVAVPGASELVGALTDGRWAVVTSAGRRLAERRLAAAGIERPAVLVTADDVVRPKPDPEGYLIAAARLGVGIETCVVFEDSEAGVRAGVASGARTVVVGGLALFDGELSRVDDLTAVDPHSLVPEVAVR